MTTTPPPPQQIQLHIPPSLIPYTHPPSTFLANNPLYSRLAVSAIILSPPASTSPSPSQNKPHDHDHDHDHNHHLPPTSNTHKSRKILLLRRAPTERAFPSKWELPGGSAEASDPTVLHSVAREVFEETGLRVCRFVREVGGGGGATCDAGSNPGTMMMQKMDFTTGEGEDEKARVCWAKRVFEVEVVEMLAERQSDDGEGGGKVEVQLDPAEHAEFVWADRDEVERLRGEMVSEAVYGVVVDGLEGGV